MPTVLPIEFRATAAAELADVRHLLREVFNAEADAPFLSERNLHWKYYQHRDDWPSSRSYVLARDVRLVAHAAVWPMHFQVNGKILKGIYPIDWAANSEVTGSGVNLLRGLREMADFSICVGGTQIARKIIKRIGYVPAGEIKFYARPLRPWLQARTHQRRDWKLAARFVRNSFWAARGGARRPAGWSFEKILADNLQADLWPRSEGSVTAPWRTPEQFRYLSECPVAKYELYVARQSGNAKGYFLLSFVPGQARIADSWVPDQADWLPLFRLAVQAARQHSDAAEVTTASSLLASQLGLEAGGFRAVETLPIMLFDPTKAFAGAPPLHFQLIDNDFSFLHQGRPEYLT